MKLILTRARKPRAAANSRGKKKLKIQLDLGSLQPDKVHEQIQAYLQHLHCVLESYSHYLRSSAYHKRYGIDSKLKEDLANCFQELKDTLGL